MFCTSYLIWALSITDPKFPETYPPQVAQIIIDPCTPLVKGIVCGQEYYGTIDNKGYIYLEQGTSIVVYEAKGELE